MLGILIWITVVVIVLVGVLLYFSRLKKTGRWGWGLPKFTLPKIGSLGGEGTVFSFLSGYILPVLLFAALLGVMWLTNESLGWWSFFTRDGKTFAALVITYLIFASAFMQEKKKAPFYQKAMVLAMIVAVVVTLIGSPSKLWNEHGWNGSNHAQTAETPHVERMQHAAPQRQSYTVEVTAEEGAFTEVKVPDLSKFDFICPQGTLMVIVHTGVPEGQITDCDIQEKIAFSDNLRGLRLGFQSKDSTPKHVAVTINPKS